MTAPRHASEKIPSESATDRRRESGGSLHEWAFKIKAGEGGLIAILRSWLRVIFIVIHEFTAAAISLRAGALTYAVVLSLVPLLAMSTAILKGLGGGDQLKTAAYRVLDQLDPGSRMHEETSAPQGPLPKPTQDIQDPAIQEAGPTASPNSAGQPPVSATKNLRRAVDAIFTYVDRTNFTAIGAFGIVGLLLTVILVMSTIEDAMNTIWHTDQGRSLLRKVMDYLALLLLLPVSLNVAIAGEAVLASPGIMARVQAVIPSPWLINTLLKLLPFFFVILSLTVMYLFFPGTKVKTTAALGGAFCAAVFWFIGQKLYLVLQIGVAKYNAIYGSFATVPLFLIWVQLGWIFILLGATLAYAIQNRNHYRLPDTHLSPGHQLQLAFDVLQVVHANFTRKKKTSVAGLISVLKKEQPGDILATADLLMRGGFLLRTDSRRPIYLPTSPAETLNPGEVVRQVLGQATVPTPGGELARHALNAAADAISNNVFPNPLPTEKNDAESPDKEEVRETTL